MVIDSAGIALHNPNWSIIQGSGTLSSNQPFLDIAIYTGTGNTHQRGLRIDAPITNNEHQKVGLRLSRRGGSGAAVVYLGGDKNNTFTGDVVISGGNNYLALRKEKGAIAVRGNVFVNGGAVLRLDESQQLAYSSNVTLKGGTLYHSITKTDLTTHFHSLKVEGGSVLSFGSEGTHVNTRYVYLDELAIAANGHLLVNEWGAGRDFFLVKKTMNKKALDAMLGKIEFKGWLPGRTHLESFNKDYWAISGTPEPATYGAIIGTLGTGLVLWRKRKRGTG